MIIKPFTSDFLLELRDLSYSTFVETYKEKNDPLEFRDYLDKAFSLNQLKKEINNPWSQFYCGFSDKKMVAYLKVNEEKAQTDFKSQDSLEIERIYVAVDFQKKGLGRLMIDQAISLAKKKRKKYIWLGVWDQNPEAIAFYKRMNFVESGNHIFRIGNEDQNDVVMKLYLE